MISNKLGISINGSLSGSFKLERKKIQDIKAEGEQK